MRERPLILLCDDDAEFLKSVQLGLRSAFEIHAANSVVRAKALVAMHEYDAAIIDLNFEGQELDGIHLLDHMGKVAPGTVLIVLSGDTSVKRAIEATRRRLFEFIHKDGDFFPALHAALTRTIQLRRSKEAATAKRYLTESPAVKELLKTAERILGHSTDAPILILGETGSGKEFLAQHIAQALKLKLVAANMAGIPRDTAESVLFGHERGAFTGAVSNKIGLIESANDGIFFLDEIGESSPEVQAKLLRVLQEREVLPLGGLKARAIKTRFIAATHRNLEQMVSAGSFRLDLLQRLNTFVLRLPPLRERPEDVIYYANLFLDELREDSAHFSLMSDAIQELLSYSWPGNIRELKSVIQRIVILSNKTSIDAQSVRNAIEFGRDAGAGRTTSKPVEVVADNARRDQLIRALEETGGNKRLAAKSLSISEATVYRWIHEFGLRTMQRVQSLRPQEKAL